MFLDNRIAVGTVRPSNPFAAPDLRSVSHGAGSPQKVPAMSNGPRIN
jgi:hypothetical protein